MITKDECMKLLVDMHDDNNINVIQPMRMLASAKEPPIEVLKFIAKNRGFEAARFYEILRIKHNESNSKLYTNIIRNIEDEQEIIITLSSLLTQIFLHVKKSQTSDDFYKNVRADEILKSLNYYIESGNISPCKRVLGLIRSDILVFEYLDDRRDLV